MHVGLTSRKYTLFIVKHLKVGADIRLQQSYLRLFILTRIVFARPSLYERYAARR